MIFYMTAFVIIVRLSFGINVPNWMLIVLMFGVAFRVLDFKVCINKKWWIAI